MHVLEFLEINLTHDTDTIPFTKGPSLALQQLNEKSQK